MTDNQEFNIELLPAKNAKSMLSEAGASAPREAIWKVPFDKLVVLPGFNVRSHDSKWEERVDALKQDMIENGYRTTKPMEVFIDEKGQIVVADGHTRHEALRRAHEEADEELKARLWDIPAIPLPKGTTMEDLTIGLYKSNTGTPITPLGVSKIVNRLVKNHGLNQSEAARKLGITPKYAGDLLLLSTSPSALQKMVEEEKVSATLAMATIVEHGGEEALRILQEGLEKAEKVGKKKVTKKHTEENEDEKLEKACKKYARTMQQLISMLMEPDTEKEIPQALADKFEQVLTQIDEQATGE